MKRRKEFVIVPCLNCGGVFFVEKPIKKDIKLICPCRKKKRK